MLNLDPRQRISALSILKHPWLVNMERLPDFKLNLNDTDGVRVCFENIISNCQLFCVKLFSNQKLVPKFFNDLSIEIALLFSQDF
jgi:hypothetical protein